MKPETTENEPKKQLMKTKKPNMNNNLMYDVTNVKVRDIVK